MSLPQRPLLIALMMLTAGSLAGPAGAAAPAGQYIVSGSGSAATVFDTKSRLTWQQRAGTLGTWAEAKAYCAGLTTGGTGWRLPTFKELITLLDLSQPSRESNVLKMDPLFGFTGTGGFWSATLEAGNPSRAWNVNFFYGDTYPYPVTNTNAAKCVR